MPPTHSEKEVDWHMDLLRWHAKEIAGRAFLLPETHLEAFYKAAHAELRSSGELSVAEAAAVVGLAKGVGPTINAESFSRVEWAKFQDGLIEEWRQLGERLACFAAHEKAE